MFEKCGVGVIGKKAAKPVTAVQDCLLLWDLMVSMTPVDIIKETSKHDLFPKPSPGVICA